jgi:UrcA family protein
LEAAAGHVGKLRDIAGILFEGMLKMKALSYFPRLCWLMAGVAFLGTSPAASAQGEPEELVVTGRYGRVPDNVQSLSQAVSYADLDLSTAAGKSEFRRRLNLTARYLGEKLGESASATPPVPSCRDAAVKDALDRAGTLEAHFAPRGTSWVTGKAWQAPYPEEWAKGYKE